MHFYGFPNWNAAEPEALYVAITLDFKKLEEVHWENLRFQA
jgi:hypothetical protein